jgi:cell division protein FtsQ
MARRSSATIQEELYSTPDEPAREELDDARLLDLDAEKESPFLRAQKRVPARRSPLPRKTAARILWALLIIAMASLFCVAAAAMYHYGQHSWRFRLNSSDDIEMAGLSNVTRGQVMEVMGGDIGRNVFFIPLDQRQKQLEQIPWVETASVLRFAPDRIRIEIQERTPAAFARVGSKVMLVDASGVLMDLAAKKRYSFPVILGLSSSQPLSTRGAQMRIYNQLVRELDASGGRYSQDLSEVDLSDPEDVKVLTNDPDGEVVVHLGSSNYLNRFRIYGAHLREWRQQFPKLESVDLRYDRQIIVNPDLRGTERQPPLSSAAAKAALAAGVKPAALVQHDPAKSLPHAATPKVPAAKSAARRARPKTRAAVTHKPAAHAAAKPSRTAAHATNHAGTGVSGAGSSEARQTPASPKPSPVVAKGQDRR